MQQHTSSEKNSDNKAETAKAAETSPETSLSLTDQLGSWVNSAHSPTHLMRQAIARPRSASPKTILNLQRNYGNQAVLRLLGKQPALPPTPKVAGNPIQRTGMAEVMDEQQERFFIAHNKDKSESEKGAYTTVGFEWDIAYTQDDTPTTPNVFQGLTHVELAKSDFKWNKLPYILETDAGNTLEFVTPPFFVKVQPGTTIPQKDDLQKIINATRQDLKNVVKKDDSLAALFQNPNWKNFNITKWNEEDLSEAIDWRNWSTRAKPQSQITPLLDSWQDITLKAERLDENPQINIAVMGQDYADLNSNLGSRLGKSDEQVKDFKQKQNQLKAWYLGNKLTENIEPEQKSRLDLVLDQLSLVAVQHTIVQDIEETAKMQKTGFLGGQVQEKPFQAASGKASYVKDTGGVWLKTDLLTYATSIMQPADWGVLLTELIPAVEREIKRKKKLPILTEIPLEAVLAELKKYAGEMATAVKEDEKNSKEKSTKKAYGEKVMEKFGAVAKGKPEFNEHNKAIVGVRQDTFISPLTMNKLSKELGFKSLLSVVEIRNTTEFLKYLGKAPSVNKSTKTGSEPSQQTVPNPEAPGTIKHIFNSCYLASILNMLAANDEYLDLLDTNKHKLTNGADALQLSLFKAAQAVKTGEGIDRTVVRELLVLLRANGLLADGNITSQQDAAQVFIGILDVLEVSQGLTATVKYSSTKVKEGPAITTPVPTPTKKESVENQTTKTSSLTTPTVSKPSKSSSTPKLHKVQTDPTLSISVAADTTLVKALESTYQEVIDKPLTTEDTNNEKTHLTVQKWKQSETNLISTLPPVLTIMVDRPEQGKELQFGETLELPKSSLMPELRQASATYTLTGCIIFGGKDNAGHYIPCIKRGDGFYINDDLPGKKPRIIDMSDKQVFKAVRILTYEKTGGEDVQPNLEISPIGAPGKVTHVDNSCYLASIINLLTANRHYLSLLNSENHKPATGGEKLQVALANAVQAVYKGEEVSKELVTELLELLKEAGLLPNGNIKSQQDAAQIFVGILDMLNISKELSASVTYNTSKLKDGSAVVTALPPKKEVTKIEEQVYGELVKPVESRKRQKDPSLSVTISADTTIIEALENTYQAFENRPLETNDTNDKKTHVTTQKWKQSETNLITSLPSLLTIMVDRLVPGNVVQFEDTLELPKSCLAPELAGAETLYTLTSFMLFQGSDNAGHYIACVRKGDVFYLNDDLASAPVKLTLEEVLSKKYFERVRMLTYRKG